MGRYLGDKRYDFALVVFDGERTADEAFDMLKARERRTQMTLQEAAVFTLTPSGHIKLHNKGFVGGWKGGTLGLGIGLLLGGPVVGALVGSLIGFDRNSDRHALSAMLRERLGLEQSALAIVVENGNRDEIAAALEAMDGEAVYTELQGDSLSRLEDLATDDELTAEAEKVFDEVSTESPSSD